MVPLNTAEHYSSGVGIPYCGAAGDAQEHIGTLGASPAGIVWTAEAIHAWGSHRNERPWHDERQDGWYRQVGQTMRCDLYW